jgi:hypothetical protein
MEKKLNQIQFNFHPIYLKKNEKQELLGECYF